MPSVLPTESATTLMTALAVEYRLTTRYTLADTQKPHLTVLCAAVVSAILHGCVWLMWQTRPEPATLLSTPPQVMEVVLTAAPTPAPQPAAPLPSAPQKPQPLPKPVVKKIIKTKPKLKPRPKPPAPPVPAPQPAVRFEPTPVVAPASTAPAQPAAPVAEPLVKAAYSSPSLHNPPTRYPRIAQMRQWEGTVMLEIQVLANGTAGKVKIARSSGHDVLDESAVEQVKAWRFMPAHRGAQTVDDWVRIPITFKFKR